MEVEVENVEEHCSARSSHVMGSNRLSDWIINPRPTLHNLVKQPGFRPVLIFMQMLISQQCTYCVHSDTVSTLQCNLVSRNRELDQFPRAAQHPATALVAHRHCLSLPPPQMHTCSELYNQGGKSDEVSTNRIGQAA